MARCCSISHPRHSVIWCSPCWGKCPGVPFQARYTYSFDIFGKVFTISYNFHSSSLTSQHHSAPAEAVQVSFEGFQPHMPSLLFWGCHTNTSGLWLSPELLCSGEPRYSSDKPKKMGHTWTGIILPQTISSVLNPLAKYMCVYIQIYYIYIYYTYLKKTKNNKVINTVIAWAYLGES